MSIWLSSLRGPSYTSEFTSLILSHLSECSTRPPVFFLGPILVNFPFYYHILTDGQSSGRMGQDVGQAVGQGMGGWAKGRWAGNVMDGPGHAPGLPGGVPGHGQRVACRAILRGPGLLPDVPRIKRE